MAQMMLLVQSPELKYTNPHEVHVFIIPVSRAEMERGDRGLCQRLVKSAGLKYAACQK